MKISTVLKVALPILVIGLGFGAMRALIASKPEPPRQEPDAEGLLVQTEVVRSGAHQVAVDASGQVVAARQVIVSPEVTGRVRSQSEDLVPGGFFEEGDVMLRLDGRDYRLQVQSRAAEVRRAELELQLEQGRRVVAEREWEAFGDPGDTQPGTTGGNLALRQPQLETAEVGVGSARSAAQQARLALSKTTIRAPFNAMVLMENVDEGQLVGPSSQLATLVGTDEFWVRVSIDVAKLGAIRIEARDGEGSEARVTQVVGGERIVRRGRVIRLLPDLDPVGAMARVLVAIEDPLGLSEENDARLPMLLGSFVDVEIDAAPLTDVVEVPRVAVREGNRVFVRGEDDTLEIRTVDVAWEQPDALLVRSGIADGDEVITSRGPTAVDGLRLRVEGAPARATARRDTGAADEATQ